MKSVKLNLTGSGFQSRAQVTIEGGGVEIVSVDILSTTDIELRITVTKGAATGLRTIRITNRDGGTGQARILEIR